jgi:ATP-dependent DNA helicase RecQ
MKKERLTVPKAAPKRKVTYFDDYDVELFDQLRDLRAEIAEQKGIPPYIVFSDKTLKDLSANRPSTKTEMLEIHGIGEVKYDRYGEEFLALLKDR